MPGGPDHRGAPINSATLSAPSVSRPMTSSVARRRRVARNFGAGGAAWAPASWVSAACHSVNVGQSAGSSALERTVSETARGGRRAPVARCRASFLSTGGRPATSSTSSRPIDAAAASAPASVPSGPSVELDAVSRTSPSERRSTRSAASHPGEEPACWHLTASSVTASITAAARPGRSGASLTSEASERSESAGRVTCSASRADEEPEVHRGHGEQR